MLNQFVKKRQLIILLEFLRIKFYLKYIDSKSSHFVNNKSVKTGVIFTGGNVAVAIISAFSALLCGRWIMPEVLGEFRKYGILTGYLSVGIILVNGAFQRHFPYYLGKGNKKKALEIAAYAKSVYLILTWLGILIFSFLVIKSFVYGELRSALGWGAQIPIYTMGVYGLFFGVLYRTNEDFIKITRNKFVVVFIGLIFLPFVYYFQYYGLGFRNIIQNVIDFIVTKNYAPYKVKSKFNISNIKGLAKTSLPIALPAYIDTYLIKSTIGLIIVLHLGEKELGIYGMAIYIQSFLLIFSNSINQIFTTKIMLNYGRHDDLEKTFKYIIKPVLFASTIGLLSIIIAILAIGPLVEIIIPKYSEAVPVFKVLSLELVLSILSIPSTLFISSLMHKERIILRVSKVVLTILLLIIFHANLFQIVSIIILTKAINVIAGYIVLLFSIKNKKRLV